MVAWVVARINHRLIWLAGTLMAIGLALGTGRIVPGQPLLALGIGGVALAVGLTVAEPAMIPLITMPLLLVSFRVGGSGLDLTISDAALGVAFLTSVAFAPRPFSPALRSLLWLSTLYQFATLFTVVANPYRSGVIEWLHAWVLVAGALVVGWTAGRRGYAKAALTLLLLTSLALALATIVQGLGQYAHGNFSAVYLSWPYGMHKNFVGTVLGFAAIVAYARPSWMGWRRSRALAAFTILVAGLVMTQSRQALVGLAVALVLIALRGDPHRRRSKVIVVLAGYALVLVATSVSDQFASGNEFNSANVRVGWFHETLAYWATSPWVGHGLRYWYRPGQLTFQPPNAEMEVLASAGIVGLIAFVVLLIGALIILWKLVPTFGTLAVAIMLSRIVSGQLDLFWVSVQASVPFVIIGICVGALSDAETCADTHACGRSVLSNTPVSGLIEPGRE